MASPTRVAVVGSGVAGLTAAYVASRTAQVTLYEAYERLGGHADTHTVSEALPDGSTRDLAIDTGFIVHNPRTYPVLLRMFAELGVTTQDSEMSMSIRDDETGLEWAGALGRRGLFPTRDNLRRPSYLRMLTEIPRFHRRAGRLLDATDTGAQDQTLREFVAESGFSPYFTRHFMEPLVAAVWSCDPAVALDYPARYLFTFLRHHGMLGVFGSPQWRTVTGGSREYVRRVEPCLQEVRLGAKVTSVLETADGVQVTDGSGDTTTYDAVVVATHPGQALAMLAEPTPVQREVLGAMPYSPNTALLHTDLSLLPHAENARASWNFYRPLPEPAKAETQAGRLSAVGADPSLRGPARQQSKPSETLNETPSDVPADGDHGVVVTYDLTRLQRLDTDVHYLVSLGAEHLVDPALVLDRMEYEHPLYNPTSVAAQGRLREIDTARIQFAGAYHGWGFHEDGARSGLAAVTRLGLDWPETTVEAPELTAARTGIYATTIRHTRRRPFRTAFTHRSHTWVVDLDDLPDHGVLGRFEGRDHLDGRDHPERSIRTNLTAYLARHGVDLVGGRVLMAAHPRALGYCFNPITVFWCWDTQGRRLPSVVEVHNTYGDRHAYVVAPDDQGRAETDKLLYVSPFHGTDGRYELTVPVPTDRLDVAVSLRTDDGATFSASLAGVHDPDLTPLRAAPESLRGGLLIRLHGIALWARRLPIRPRPVHRQEGVQ